MLLDFNSIIHNASQNVVAEINYFLQTILKNSSHQRSALLSVFDENFQKYHMQDVRKDILPDSDPMTIIEIFHEHFSEDYLDKLIITRVINTVLSIIKTFCINKSINTLMIAIDGVPSKGKMIEQKQRSYMGAISEEYKKKNFKKIQKLFVESK